jgi:hypothetical protein
MASYFGGSTVVTCMGAVIPRRRNGERFGILQSDDS